MMITPQESKDRLEHLADCIEQMEHGQPYDASNTGHKFNLQKYITKTRAGPNLCGTTCCIAGEAVRMFHPDNFALYMEANASFSSICWFYSAQKALGLNKEDAYGLFYGVYWDKPNEDVTPQEAADALREVAARRKV